MEDFSTEKRSEFNEAFLKMRRISELQNEANIAQITGNEKQWFHIVSALFKEIYSKLTPKEKTECYGTITLIGARLRNLIQISNAEFAALPTLGSIPPPVSSILFEFDCRIRELADTHGFASPDREDPRGAILS